MGPQRAGVSYALILACLGLLLAALPASASTVTAAGGVLRVNDDADQANAITVRFARNAVETPATPTGLTPQSAPVPTGLGPTTVGPLRIEPEQVTITPPAAVGPLNVVVFAAYEVTDTEILVADDDISCFKDPTTIPPAPEKAICKVTVAAVSSAISSVRVDAAGGDDSITLDASVLIPSTVDGGAGSDTITGGAGSDVLIGDARGGDPEPDILNGGGGSDSVDYSDRDFDEPLSLSADGLANDGADEGAEGDNIAADIETLIGGSGDDELSGAAGAQTLRGGLGADLLDGGAGADIFDGGDGTDTVTYAARSTSVSASLDGAANDGEAAEGDNVQAGVENLIGGGAADQLTGGAGDNSLSGGPGADTFDGGTGGEDTVDYLVEDRPAAVRADIDDNADDGAVGENDNVTSTIDNIRGTAHADTLTGSSAANKLTGAGGDDALNGFRGADTLLGEEGVDTLAGEEDADRLDGGPGNDFIDGELGDDTILESSDPSGADRIAGGSGEDSVDYSGRSASLTIDADGLADDGASGEGDNVLPDVERITGGDGADLVTGAGAANTLSGGKGDDHLVGGSGSDALNGDQGADILEGGDGSDSLSGGRGDDELNGGNGNDALIDGGEGDDVLDGGLGAESLDGGGGTDVASYESRTAAVMADLDTESGDDGELGEADTILASVEGLAGGSGNDQLVGGAGPNEVSGGDGDDSLAGAAGADSLEGDAGADSLDGGDDGDELDGGKGNDQVSGGAGDDELDGLEGMDSLQGGDGTDALDGGDGTDTVDGGSGADVLNGGEGSDTATYAARTLAVTVRLDPLANDGEIGEGDRIASDVENAVGGSGDDQLHGDATANALDGGSGADTIDGNEGADTLRGGEGSDFIDGDEGSDLLSGGAGADELRGGVDVDLVDYWDRTEPVVVSIDGEANDGAAGEGDNVRKDVEDIRGGEGADTLSGDQDANLLEGGAGADSLTGDAGSDTLAGGPDDDALHARDGESDLLLCGDGADAGEADTIDNQVGCEGVTASGPAAASPQSEPEVAQPPAADPVKADSKPVKGLAAPSASLSLKPGTVTSVSRAGKFSLPITCPSPRGTVCSGTIKLTVRDVRGRKITLRVRYRVPGSTTRQVAVRLPAKVLALTKPGVRLPVKVVIENAAGRVIDRDSLLLKAPPRRGGKVKGRRV